MGVRDTMITIAWFVGVALFFVVGIGAGMLFAASVAPTPDSPATVDEPVEEFGPTPPATQTVEGTRSGSTGSDREANDAPTPPPTLAPESTLTPTETTPTVPPNVTVTGDTRQFTFTITAIDECGSRCRDVTARLENTGDAVTNVSLQSTLYAGRADGDAVWSDRQTVGSMDPDSRTTVTSRLSVGVLDGIKLCGAARATMVTTVRSSDHEQRFTTHPVVC